LTFFAISTSSNECAVLAPSEFICQAKLVRCYRRVRLVSHIEISESFYKTKVETNYPEQKVNPCGDEFDDSPLQQVVAEQGYGLDQPVIKPADLDFMHDARLQELRGLRFPLANLVGAVLIMISLFVEWNLPSVVIEGFWIAISLFGLAKYARGRRSG